MRKPYLERWYTKYGVSRVLVRETTQQRPHGLPPVKIYRDKWGVTYPARYIREWSQLSEEQKISAYRAARTALEEDSMLESLKDPSISSRREGWAAKIDANTEAAVEAILRGEDVPPPKQYDE